MTIFLSLYIYSSSVSFSHASSFDLNSNSKESGIDFSGGFVSWNQHVVADNKNVDITLDSSTTGTLAQYHADVACNGFTADDQSIPNETGGGE